MPGYVDLIFPIKNTGSHTLLFQLEGTAVSDGVRKLFKSERIYVPPGNINAFDATFWVDGEGETEISLELHNVVDFVSPRDSVSSPLDTMTFTLRVTEEIPAPLSTATPPLATRRTAVLTPTAASAIATRPAVPPPAPAFARGDEAPTPVPPPVSSGSCRTLTPERTDWDPDYRFRTIELLGFNKPVYSNLKLEYVIANPKTSRDTFYLDTKILSHPELFSEFNSALVSELDLMGGHGIQITENIHIDGEGVRETTAWQNFDYGCQFQIGIYVYADQNRRRLLENLLITVKFDENSDAVYSADKQQYSQELLAIFECIQTIPIHLRPNIARLLVEFGFFDNSKAAEDALNYYYSFAVAVQPLVQGNPTLISIAQSALLTYCGSN